MLFTSDSAHPCDSAVGVERERWSGGHTWFTADLHLGHRRVATLRGFVEPSHQDDELAARWDAMVSNDDCVWVLGDISGGGRGSQMRALEWLGQRPGLKHLVAGNHDGVHPMRVDADRMRAPYLEVFSSVRQSGALQLAGQTVLLSHFPYVHGYRDRSDRRFDQWQLADRGQWLLHGHVHTGQRHHDRRSIHVGLDAWDLRPVSGDTIAGIIHSAVRTTAAELG